ncbi:MAG: hypothetical protein ACP5F1_02295 [Thermoplasmata archaeon]|nr:hypothetical protein [Thermoplasmata archaeon]
MLSKKQITEELQNINREIENLKLEIKSIGDKQNELSKILEELESKIAFLNVLSAKINTTYYHITYDIDDKLKEFLSEIKEDLESLVNEFNEKVSESIQSIDKRRKK